MQPGCVDVESSLKNFVMEKLFVKMLLLDGAQFIGIFFLLIVFGGIVAASLFTVTSEFRRIKYLWFVAVSSLAIMICQLGWLLLPAAAEANLFSLLVLALLSVCVIFGAALYYGSAARSNDINGTRSAAWMGFVPIVNLYLMFAASGTHSENHSVHRTTAERFLIDPLLVVGGVLVLGFGNSIEKLVELAPAPVYQEGEAQALASLFATHQTLGERFAAEAAASSQQLPLRIDEITVFQSIHADGSSLRMFYDVEQQIESFVAGFKQGIASDICRKEMFANEFRLGGKIIYTYRGPDGKIIDELEFTQDDCET
jgi:hypothetical protein